MSCYVCMVEVVGEPAAIGFWNVTSIDPATVDAGYQRAEEELLDFLIARGWTKDVATRRVPVFEDATVKA